MMDKVGNPRATWRGRLITRVRTIPFEEKKPCGERTITFRKLPEAAVLIDNPMSGGIYFRVSHRRDRKFCFVDTREEATGHHGSTGIWGTWPASPQGRRHSLTPTAFVAETSRLIGFDRAQELVQEAQEWANRIELGRKHRGKRPRHHEFVTRHRA